MEGGLMNCDEKSSPYHFVTGELKIYLALMTLTQLTPTTDGRWTNCDHKSCSGELKI
jgi:hypothetical protein